MTASSIDPAVQRRTLVVLVVAQVFSGAGIAAGITVGALLAQDMLGSTDLAGLPSALFTAGSALTAITVGRLSHARGRRPGLAAGYLAGALGSVGVLLAAALNSPPLLFAALFVYGAGTATNLQARYAGADLADPAHRARAVSTVLVATTLGGVIGPNLATPMGDVAEALGIPRLAGLFLLSGTAYLSAAVILAVWLRPDPLLLSRTLPPEPRTAPADGSTRRSQGWVPGALIMLLVQPVMVAIMTMTPVHMHDHGHGTSAAGLVIAIHIGAMYLPSLLTGRLVDRHGTTPAALAAGAALVAAGVLAAIAPADSVPLLAIALALLGLGWNLGVVAGSTMITNALPAGSRAKTQGAVDVSIALAGSTGGITSGLLVDAAGYSFLALTGAALALLIPVAVATTRSRPVG
ncbi:MFS transporter [Actinokineospora enzanensis]|uniref:MFS transporter n=1 Tax=Actinokineospora enzanensis TaxID=155975 RepID=UPI0003770159|nr:MFS transporter [Actinokineospora enzanensis]